MSEPSERIKKENICVSKAFVDRHEVGCDSFVRGYSKWNVSVVVMKMLDFPKKTMISEITQQ